MAHLMVAVIEDGFGHSIGFRLIDTRTYAIVDTSEASIIKVIESKQASVANLEVRSNRVIGSNGALARYARIDRNGVLLSGKSPLVVICRVGQNFKIANYQGKVVVVTEKSAIDYSKAQGVANGKITNRHGNEVLSSIVGYYPEENPPKAQPTPKAPEVAKAQPTPKTPASKPQEATKPQATPSNESLPIEVVSAIKYYLTNVLKTNGSLSHPDSEYILKVRREDKLFESVASYQGILAMLGFIGDTPGNSLSELETFKSTKKLLESGLSLPDTLVKMLWSDIRKKMGLSFYCSLFNFYSGNLSGLYNSNSEKDKQLRAIVFDTLNKDAYPTVNELRDILSCLDYYLKIKTASGIVDKIIDQAGFEVITHDNKVCNYFINKHKLGPDEANILLIILTYTAKSEDISKLSSTDRELVNDTIYRMSISDKSNQLDIGFDKDLYKLARKLIGICSDDKISFDIDTIEDTEQNNSETDESESSITEDRLSYLENLLDKAKLSAADYNNISISIAKDILKKKIAFKNLTPKQLFRINQAIEICEAKLGIIKGDKKVGPAPAGMPTPISSKEVTGPDGSITVNNTYKYDDIVGLKQMLAKIEAYETQPGMKEVYASSPKILEICASIKKRGKVSDKQLKHIVKSIEIINKANE